jgi:uncharacterized protein (UPF0305 family)
LHSTKWSAEKKKKGWKPLSSKKKNNNNNNSIQDLVGNEENGCPVPDVNKIMIDVTKGPSETHTKTLKEEILEAFTEKFIEKILDMVNQNVQGCTQEISRYQK